MASRGPRCAQPLLVVLLCYVCPLVLGDCNATSLSPQLEAVLAEYDRDAAPDALVDVAVSLDVRHAAVDDTKATLRLLADLHMSWKDSRLVWNISECEFALTSAERLWLPDVELVNAAAASAGDSPLRARIASDGAVTWVARLDVAIPIAVRLDDWPDDVQTGEFKFASRSKTIENLDLTVKDVEYVAVFESGTWEIESVTSRVSLQPTVQGGSSRRRLAVWRLSLRRRAHGRLLAARVTTAAAVLLLVAAGFLPPAARAPLAAAAAGTAAFWLCGAVWRLPGGAGVPRGLRLSAAVGGAAAACALCAALCARVGLRTASPPAPLRSLLATASGVWVLSPPAESGGECATWAAAARLLDAALLAGLALALLVMMCVWL